MTVNELYRVSPQAFLFIVERDADLNVTARHEYKGGKADGAKKVARVTPTKYPMYAHVLEVEVEADPEIRLNAEWISYMKAYRLYDPRYPQQTVAYVDTIDEAQRPGYKIVEVDADTMHVECY